MTRSKPAVVGSFLLGALALGVIAILAFGGMNLFAHKLRVVVVFSDSIAGLEVGAPVTFRGARIGRVEGMRLHIDVHHQTGPLDFGYQFGQIITLQDEGIIPPASLVMRSGRGLWLFWLLADPL